MSKLCCRCWAAGDCLRCGETATIQGARDIENRRRNTLTLTINNVLLIFASLCFLLVTRLNFEVSKELQIVATEMNQVTNHHPFPQTFPSRPRPRP